MKLMGIITAAILFTSLGHANTSLSSAEVETIVDCRSILQESLGHAAGAEKLTRLIELEKRVAYLREQNGQIERKNVAEARKKEAQLAIHLQRGEKNAAIDLYRTTFRAVEFGYIRVKQIRVEMQKLENSQTDDPELGREIETQHFLLAQEQRLRLKEFGTNYSEYIRARQKLERLIDEAKSIVSKDADTENGADTYHMLQIAEREKFARNAELVLSSLQIRSLLEAAPEAELPQTVLTVQEIHEFFKQEAEAIEAHLTSDLTEEERIRRWAVIYPMLEAFRSVVYRLPTWAVSPTSLALGLSYNHYVREKYFPDVERLLRYRTNPDHNIENLYEELTRINAQYASVRQDDFLVTLARVKDATKLWIELKQESKRLSDASEEAIYDQFYERMLEAEKRALKMGDLPLYFEGSPVDKKVVGAFGILTGLTGVYLTWGQDISAWASSVLMGWGL